jgi:hypothetical protein
MHIRAAITSSNELGSRLGQTGELRCAGEEPKWWRSVRRIALSWSDEHTEILDRTKCRKPVDHVLALCHSMAKSISLQIEDA